MTEIFTKARTNQTVGVTSSDLIGLCDTAFQSATQARSRASAAVYRSQAIRGLAATLIRQGDTPWPESAHLESSRFAAARPRFAPRG